MKYADNPIFNKINQKEGCFLGENVDVALILAQLVFEIIIFRFITN